MHVYLLKFTALLCFALNFIAPLDFGQVRADGFYTSVNGIFLSIFPHRSDISRYK